MSEYATGKEPMERPTRLIVNADDFGISPGVNRGIIAAHEHGIVTSSSLMVRWPAAAEAAAYGRMHPELSIGLHIDLCEWEYRDERWAPCYEVVPPGDAVALQREIQHQLHAFRELLGYDPAHIDSHQHVHLEEPVSTIARATADEIGVPLRHFSRQITYRGDFYGQTGKGLPYPEGITVERLLYLFAALPPGVTELGCHPGLDADVDSMYRTERGDEVRTLCDPAVRAAIVAGGIQLCSFATIAETTDG
jgi:predicted glycoside hydrolase/deacetylase ChbG (UPF0249 family)